MAQAARRAALAEARSTLAAKQVRPASRLSPRARGASPRLALTRPAQAALAEARVAFSAPDGRLGALAAAQRSLCHARWTAVRELSAIYPVAPAGAGASAHPPPAEALPRAGAGGGGDPRLAAANGGAAAAVLALAGVPLEVLRVSSLPTEPASRERVAAALGYAAATLSLLERILAVRPSTAPSPVNRALTLVIHSTGAAAVWCGGAWLAQRCVRPSRRVAPALGGPARTRRPARATAAACVVSALYRRVRCRPGGSDALRFAARAHASLPLTPRLRRLGDRARFVQAVLLLNRDLERLLNAFGLPAVGPRHTAAHLARLMSPALRPLPPPAPPDQERRALKTGRDAAQPQRGTP